jgi:hypothetical protein
MHDEYLRSDYREKLVRASRREHHQRHNPFYSGKVGKDDVPRRWGGKVPIVDHSTWQFDGPYYAGEAYDYPDEFGGIHGTSKQYGWVEDGYFSHHVAKQWLRKQAGRPWNDVWSEICKRFDSRSYVGKERRDVFFDPHSGFNNVETNCYVSIDGKVRDTQSYYEVSGLYVHPDTGILCYNPESLSWKAKKRHASFITDEIGLRKNGEWFFIGEYRNAQLHYDYKFKLEKCGTHSKSADKNMGKNWFYYWDEVSSEAIWKPCYNQKRSPLYYHYYGYVKNEDGIWGEITQHTTKVSHKKSCSRKQIKWIKDAQAGTLPEHKWTKKESMDFRMSPWR